MSSGHLRAQLLLMLLSEQSRPGRSVKAVAVARDPAVIVSTKTPKDASRRSPYGARRTRTRSSQDSLALAFY